MHYIHTYDCDKCCNKVHGTDPYGKPSVWCKPMHTDGTNPLRFKGDRTIVCKCYKQGNQELLDI